MPRTTIRIIGKEGVPVSGAHVSVLWSSVPVPEFSYLSDADGVMTLDLQPGDYCFRADAPDGRSGEARVAIPETVVVNIFMEEL